MNKTCSARTVCDQVYTRFNFGSEVSSLHASYLDLEDLKMQCDRLSNIIKQKRADLPKEILDLYDSDRLAETLKK